MMQLRFYNTQPQDDELPWKIQHILNFSAINLAAALFSIFVLCTGTFFHGKCWRIICVTIHFLLHVAGLAFIITCFTGHLDHTWYNCKIHMSTTISDHELEHLFRTAMFCFGAHFVLGLLIFSGLNLARLITPILSASFFVLRRATDLFCCSSSVWLAFNHYLESLLLSEEEREIEERKREEMEGKMDKEEQNEKKDQEKGLEMGDCPDDIQHVEEDKEVEENRKAKMMEKEKDGEKQEERKKGEVEDLEMGDLCSCVDNHQLPEEEKEEKVGEEKRREGVEEAEKMNSKVQDLEMGDMNTRENFQLCKEEQGNQNIRGEEVEEMKETKEMGKMKGEGHVLDVGHLDMYISSPIA